MNPGEQIGERKEGWQHENWRMSELLAFTRKAHAASRPDAEGRVVYDSSVELHYSGGSPESYGYWLVDEELPEGLRVASETVDVLYDASGAPVKIHGYVNLDRGQGTDVYLQGKALADYLGA
ncbi:MAG: hypothetical protein AAB473_04625 [Patescibacteria group bacterium]